MARGGMATVAIVGIVVVVLVGAGVFGYMYLMPSSHNSSTTSQSSTNEPATTLTTSSTTQGNVVISNAALSNSTLLVTIQNTGSTPVSVSSLLVTPGSGCSSTSFFRSTTSTSASTTSSSQTNQTRPAFALPACMEGAVVFTVQSNSTLKPIALGQFNFTHAFNSTTFSRTFSRNASRTFSGNFSRTISGNFTRGGFPGFPGNFTGGGVQLAAGQSVTLAYAGQMGSGVTAGSQYTIMVTGQGAEAQITVDAT